MSAFAYADATESFTASGRSPRRFCLTGPFHGLEPEDLAVMVGEVLRRMRFEVAFRRHLTIAKRQEEKAVPVECDLSAVMTAALRNVDAIFARATPPAVLQETAR